MSRGSDPDRVEARRDRRRQRADARRAKLLGALAEVAHAAGLAIAAEQLLAASSVPLAREARRVRAELEQLMRAIVERSVELTGVTPGHGRLRVRAMRARTERPPARHLRVVR